MRKFLSDKIEHDFGLVRRQSTPESGYREWSSSGSPFLSQQVGGICQTCNGGWMQELDASLDTTVIALAKGDPQVLTPDWRARLARWARKYASCHQQQMQGSIFFTMERTTVMAKDDSVPDGAHLWIMRTDQYEKVFDRLITFTGPNIDVPRAAVSTLAMGKVAFVYLEHDGGAFGRRLQERVEEVAASLGATRLWPFYPVHNLTAPASTNVSQPEVWYLSGGAQNTTVGGPRAAAHKTD